MITEMGYPERPKSLHYCQIPAGMGLDAAEHRKKLQNILL
jgi:hypothetical protein